MGIGETGVGETGVGETGTSLYKDIVKIYINLPCGHFSI